MALHSLPDFAVGACAANRCITGRILFRVPSVIACAQWFGDLVTCNYWNELWLNEGFANYWQGAAVDAVRPEMDNMGYYYTDHATMALDADASAASTHPLSRPAGQMLAP